MTKIRIDTFPVSTNNMYLGRRIMSRQARAAKEAIAWEAQAGYKGKLLSGPVHISVDIFWPNHRRRDLDNLKMVFDALTGIVWEDDSQIEEMHLYRHVDPKDPRIEIKIL